MLTTHYMDEAQRLCDRIIIIDHGEILDEGSPQELIERHVLGHVFEVRKPLPAALKGDHWEHEDIGDAVLFYVRSSGEFMAELPENADYIQRQANLEDVFLRLTGRKLREA